MIQIHIEIDEFYEDGMSALCTAACGLYHRMLLLHNLKQPKNTNKIRSKTETFHGILRGLISFFLYCDWDTSTNHETNN